MRKVALYHVMRASDDFDSTADKLFQIVEKAAREFPKKPRALFLDVEGHRNDAGGFDHDALEIQTHFLIGYLGRWLSEIHTPLAEVQSTMQRENLPESLTVLTREDLNIAAALKIMKGQ